jgi:hypothetical protein
MTPDEVDKVISELKKPRTVDPELLFRKAKMRMLDDPANEKLIRQVIAAGWIPNDFLRGILESIDNERKNQTTQSL